MTAGSVEERESLRPLDLLKYDGPLYVKNLGGTKIVHDDNKGNQLILGPNGSDSDLAMLPLDVARNPGFQKIWRAGQVLVSKDEEMEEALRIVEKNIIQQEKTRAEGIQAQVQPSANTKSVTPTDCLAGGCTQKVYQNAQQAANTPPLCPVHQGRASEYIMTVTQAEDGTDKTVWTSIG